MASSETVRGRGEACRVRSIAKRPAAHERPERGNVQGRSHAAKRRHWSGDKSRRAGVERGQARVTSSTAEPNHPGTARLDTSDLAPTPSTVRSRTIAVPQAHRQWTPPARQDGDDVVPRPVRVRGQAWLHPLGHADQDQAVLMPVNPTWVMDGLSRSQGLYHVQRRPQSLRWRGGRQPRQTATRSGTPRIIRGLDHPLEHCL